MAEQNTDFNDVWSRFGAEAVRAEVLPALKRHRAKQQPAAPTAPPAEAQPVSGGEVVSLNPPVAETVPAAEAQPVAGEEPVMVLPPTRDPYFEERFILTEKGQKKSCTYNYDLVFSNHQEWQGLVGFCAFTYRIFKLRVPPWHGAETGEWTDADTINAKLWLGEAYELTPNNADVYDAIVVNAKRNTFHPVRDYLNNLSWDGVDRLDTWMLDCLDAIGNLEYLALVSRRFMIGAVARVMRPPVKMDNVLILEGAQGIGKSTAVRHLFNGWSSESAIDLSNKDAFQQIQGVWGVELAELDSFNKAETTTAKNFFSVLEDRFRPPYGRVPESVPRQCVFVGTTNQDEYLKDYSGNRRYWPVMCREVDVSLLSAMRDQLWAEAVQRFRDGERWWIEGPAEVELFAETQESRLLSDPWEDAISQWVNLPENSFTDFFTSHELLIGAMNLDSGHIQRAHQNRIAPIMKHLGWTGTRKRVKEGRAVRQVRGYARPLEQRHKDSIDAL